MLTIPTHTTHTRTAQPRLHPNSPRGRARTPKKKGRMEERLLPSRSVLPSSA